MNMKRFAAIRDCNHRVTGVRPVVANQNGSAIVIALLVLVILTLGGITATQRSITEISTIHNTAIHKQNIYIAEMAAMEAARVIIDVDAQDFETIRPGGDFDWIRDRRDWDDNPLNADASDPDSYPLNDDNSAVPLGGENTLDSRWFEDDPDDPGATFRYYFVGWQDGGPGESLDLSATARWRLGRAVGVYNSRDFGNKTVEIGLRIER